MVENEPSTVKAFSFEVSVKDKLSISKDDKSYQTLVTRLGVCEEAEAMLQPDLLNFTCYVVGNIEWYHQKLKKESSIRTFWFAISALIALALPLIIYFLESALSPSGYSLASVMLATVIAWHRTINTFFEKNRVVTGYRAAASSLKELLYEFENKWAGVLKSPSRARVFMDDCRQDIRRTILESRKIVANEKFAYFENSKPPLINLPNPTSSPASSEARINFLNDSMSQPTANFRFVGFSSEEEDIVLSAHHFGFQTISACSGITNDEKSKLRAAYLKPIIHHKITGSDFGQADTNGSFIGINLDRLLASDMPSNELPQTLIHEMMHCAGYGHPTKSANDRPGDGGRYFGSAPLRAELCIAGLQSDASGQTEGERIATSCRQDSIDGSYKIA